MKHTLFLGILCIIILFGLCFACVHTARLVRFGWQYQKKPQPTPPPKKEEEKAPPPKAAEPVYYIVEKKRKSRPSFSEPKEIRFK